MTTVREAIDQLAERRAEALFLVNPETQQEVTYRDLQTCASELSRRCLNMGLRKGEKVAFLLENGLFSPQLLLGAMYGGFVPVPQHRRRRSAGGVCPESLRGHGRVRF
jgi:acyl-CoA synthetase (AMP-forming)/AMP-acid ligase II